MVGPSGYYGLGWMTRCLKVLLAAPALSPQAGFAQANVAVSSEGVPAGAAVPTYLNAGGSYEASAKGLPPDPLTGDADIAHVLGGPPWGPRRIARGRAVELDVELDGGVVRATKGFQSDTGEPSST
jgi:hypothetical protein